MQYVLAGLVALAGVAVLVVGLGMLWFVIGEYRNRRWIASVTDGPPDTADLIRPAAIIIGACVSGVALLIGALVLLGA
jgi:hypothetical protein